MALLTFIGAIQQVTGSCYLIETRDGTKVLLECGMRQGRREDEAHNSEAFAFDPLSLDAVVLSHAHIDHSGLLPKLTRAGYTGPIYATDALVRRATSLQLTADARAPMVSVPTALWQQLGLNAGDRVRVAQGSAAALLPVRVDATLAASTVRVPAALADTANLGAMFGPIAIEKA